MSDEQKPEPKHILPGKRIETSQVKYILFKFLWSILSELGINQAAFTMAIDRFIAKNSSAVNLKKVSSIRGNMKKEFFNKNMSWPVFVKGLLFLNIPKFKLTITLFHATGKVTQHELNVDFLAGEPIDLINEEDDTTE